MASSLLVTSPGIHGASEQLGVLGSNCPSAELVHKVKPLAIIILEV